MSPTTTRYQILIGGEPGEAAFGETIGKDMSIYSMEECTQLKHVALKIA